MRNIRADLHNHFSTRAKVLDVNRVVDKVREKLGEGGICSLVNYEDRRFEAFAERAEPIGTRIGNAVYFQDRDVLIVKGQEVLTFHGDHLVLGLEEGVHLEPGKNVDYTMKEARELNGLNIGTSIFFRNNVGEYLWKNHNFVSLLDAVETHNGNATKKANLRAERFYNFFKLSKTFGGICVSDGHSFFEVGSSWTGIRSVEDFWRLEKPTDVVQVLRTGLKSTNSHQDILPRYTEHIGIESEEKYRAVQSRIGALKHIIELSPFFIGGCIGINFSRGDPEALR